MAPVLMLEEQGVLKLNLEAGVYEWVGNGCGKQQLLALLPYLHPDQASAMARRYQVAWPVRGGAKESVSSKASRPLPAEQDEPTQPPTLRRRAARSRSPRCLPEECNGADAEDEESDDPEDGSVPPLADDDENFEEEPQPLPRRGDGGEPRRKQRRQRQPRAPFTARCPDMQSSDEGEPNSDAEEPQGPSRKERTRDLDMV